MSLYLYRLEGAALLDDGMYESIEADTSVTTQAAVTVLLSSLGTGVGATAFFGWHGAVIIETAAIALLGWVAWATLMFQIGSRVLSEPATEGDLGQMLRTTGFAAGPGILQSLAAVAPAVALPIVVLTSLWMVVAMVVGVKHALDYRSLGRAVAVVIAGVLLCLGMAAALGLAFTRTSWS